MKKKYNRKLGSKRSQGIITPKAPQNRGKIFHKYVPTKMPRTLEEAAAMGILK